jgi:hypothetical protein
LPDEHRCADARDDVKRFAIRLLAIALLAGLPVAGLAATTIVQLLNDPSTYDGKHVSVSGTVKHLTPETSSGGRAFVIFALCSTSSCVRVFGWGSPQLRDASIIAVRGTFAAVRQFASYTFHNGIQADEGSL